jgi:hypothetical protein
MKMSIADKLADRLAEKAAVAGLDRLDLSVQDFALAKDGKTARVLIGYEAKYKHPTGQAIERFVQARFDNVLDTKLETALWHTDLPKPCVSVIVSARTLTRPLADLKVTVAGTDKKRFTPIVANTIYLDSVIGANWTVEVNPETGKKYLAQVRAEDIGGMLNQVRVKHAVASFGHSNTAVAFIVPEAGDYVEFFADNGLRQGEVSKVKDNEASIVEEGGNTYLTEIQNITKMLRKNPKSKSKEQKELIDALVPTMVTKKLSEEAVLGSVFRIGR